MEKYIIYIIIACVSLVILGVIYYFFFPNVDGVNNFKDIVSNTDMGVSNTKADVSNIEAGDSDEFITVENYLVPSYALADEKCGGYNRVYHKLEGDGGTAIMYNNSEKFLTFKEAETKGLLDLNFIGILKITVGKDKGYYIIGSGSATSSDYIMWKIVNEFIGPFKYCKNCLVSDIDWVRQENIIGYSDITNKVIVEDENSNIIGSFMIKKRKTVTRMVGKHLIFNIDAIEDFDPAEDTMDIIGDIIGEEMDFDDLVKGDYTSVIDNANMLINETIGGTDNFDLAVQRCNDLEFSTAVVLRDGKYYVSMENWYVTGTVGKVFKKYKD